MITCKNLYDNKNIEIISSKGGVKVLEYKKDLSVDAASAINAYFASEMNVRKRQVLIELNGNAYTISAGTMQWTAGNVKMAFSYHNLQAELLLRFLLKLKLSYQK